MPETRRALWQNKIWIISASSWLFNYDVYHAARPHEYKIRIYYNTLTLAFNRCIIVVFLIQSDIILSDNSPCHALLPRFAYETSTCNWQSACRMWRTSQSRKTTLPAPSLNTASENSIFAAICWIKTHGPNLQQTEIAASVVTRNWETWWLELSDKIMTLNISAFKSFKSILYVLVLYKSPFFLRRSRALKSATVPPIHHS